MRKLASGYQNTIHSRAASLKWNCHFYPFLSHLGHLRFSLHCGAAPTLCNPVAFQGDQTSKEADEHRKKRKGPYKTSSSEFPDVEETLEKALLLLRLLNFLDKLKMPQSWQLNHKESGQRYLLRSEVLVEIYCLTWSRSPHRITHIQYIYMFINFCDIT